MNYTDMWYVKIASDNEIYQMPLEIGISNTLRQIMVDLKNNQMEALIVGGAVRDAIMGYDPKDIDVEVYGASFDGLNQILKQYGRTDIVGRQFGVIKFQDAEGNDYDFSIPRRENKTGVGHKGFSTSFDPTITPKEAASRRDFTMNSLAWNPLTQEIHDYYGGVNDIEGKTLRATSPAFAEDALRVLRGMQFAARFGMDLDPKTAEVCRYMIENYDQERPNMIQNYINGGREDMIKAYLEDRETNIKEFLENNPGISQKELDKKFIDESQRKFPIDPEKMFAKNIYESIAKERVNEEWMKFATKGKYPGSVFDFLVSTGWIQFYPRLAQMDGVYQDPIWHPEGWSAAVVSPDSLGTSMAKAQPINFLTRELVQKAIANSATNKSGLVTSGAKFRVKPGNIFSDLHSASNTRISNFGFSPLFNSPTSVTPTKSFMGRISLAADGAHKVVRVVFEIPLSRMKSIMDNSVDDFKVVYGVIQSVAVHMVNVLRGQQIPSEVQLHDVSMEEHGANSRDANLGVSASIVEPKFSIVNGNVIFDFNLSFIGDVNIHNTSIQDNIPTYLVNMGNVHTHTGHVMNAAAEIADREGLKGDDRAVLLFSALTHDLAKSYPEHGGTTMLREKGGRMRWTSHGHEEAGGPMARELLQSMGIKKDIINKVVPLVENHLQHIHFKPGSPAQTRQLADKLHPANLQELLYLIESDHSGRPPLPKELPQEAHKVKELAEKDSILNNKPERMIQGRDILPYYGGAPGKHIGDITSAAYQAYLKGQYHNPEEAKAWLKSYLKTRAGLIKGQHVLPYYEGVPGKHIGDVTNAAWDAQLAGEFMDEPSSLEWLKQYMEKQKS